MKIAEAEEEEVKRKEIQTVKQVGRFSNLRLCNGMNAD